MLLPAKLLPQALNADDAPAFLSAHEVVNMENVRVSVSADGKNFQLKNIPSSQQLYADNTWTSPKNVGRTVDIARQRLIWMAWDADPAMHSIYAYDLPTDTTYVVVRSSQTAKGLNFSTTARADRNVRVNGDLLLWTDDLNEPCCINMEAGIKLNQPDYVTDQPPYITPIAYETVTLIKRPPGFNLTATKGHDATYTGNNIANNTYQFNYRYRYRDYEASALSGFSNYAWFNYDGTTFNFITVTMPFGEKISDEVRYVDMCVRYGNAGKTFIVRTFDKHNPDDLAAIEAHNSFATQLSYNFYDDVSGIALSDYEANTAFDSVPLRAKTLELFKNRVSLGNILAGYDTPAATSLAITPVDPLNGQVRIFKTGSAYKFSIEFLDLYRRKCGAVRSDVSVFIPERVYRQNEYIYQLHWTLSNTDALAEIPDWAVFYQILMTKNQTKQSFVETQTQKVSYVKKNTDGTYDYTGTDYNASEIYALAVDISNLYLFGQGYDYTPGDQAILYGKTENYHLKVLGQDGSNVLLTPINLGSTTNSYTGAIPAQRLEELESSGSTTNTLTMSLATSSNTVPQIVFNNTTADALDVDNARASTNNNITITGGGAYSINIAGSIVMAPRGNSVNGLFILDIRAVVTHPTEDNIIVDLFHAEGATRLITANISATVSVPAGYDKIFLYTEYISDIEGTINAGSKLTFSTTGVSNAEIELYTPYKASPEESYYEVPAIYAVNNPGTDTRTYGTLSGFINGDIALKGRHILPSTDFVVEVMSPNDYTWTDWERDLGWPNFVTDLGQQRKPTTLVWSDTYINGTKNNQFNKFNPLNSKDIGNTSGSIQKLQLTNKQQEDGNVLLILTEQVALSAYLNEVQTYKSAGADALITTDEVIGTINELKNAYGTINPESVVLYNGDVWWIDVINGLVCQYGDNGVYPVSDFKMRSFFLRYCRKYMANGYDTRNQPIHAGYDTGSDELLFALPQVEIDAFAPLLPSYDNTVPDYASDISNRFNLYDGQAKCMVYKPKTNRWTSVYRWLPDCMEYVGQRFFGWSNGMLYAFNEGTGFNTIFGITYPQRICTPINIGDASAVKQVMNIALEGNGVKPDFTVLYSTYPIEQLTDLVATDWVAEEGILRASFLRDRLSFTDAELGLLSGDLITSQNPMILIEFQAYTNPLILNFINIFVLLSKGQNSLLSK